jgi:MFS transporter, OFA family, oxalate/formate antiporter
MEKNASFQKRSIPMLILGVFLMYFYSGLQADHLNVLTPYYQKLGWLATTITNPVTWAGFVVIPATLLVGTLLLKFGIPKVVVPSAVIVGISTICLAFSGQNVVAYSISLFCMRLFILPFQMGTFMLCTNWFIKSRGRALGMVVTGSPLCTATFIALLTIGVNGIGLPKTYLITGIIILVLAALVAATIRTSPEDVGLYPDGASDAPEHEAVEPGMSFKEVFSNGDAWLLVFSLGLLQFCITSIMPFFVVRMNMTGSTPALFLAFLSAAAIGGLFASNFFGFLDDKIGTVKACLALCAAYLLAIFGLLFMGKNTIPALIVAAVGIAGITGGTGTLHPSITAYVYGRKKYQAANRWIMTVQAVIMAFGIYFMSTILDKTGSLNLAYKIMVVLVVIAVICLLFIGRKPDFDRQNNA